MGDVNVKVWHQWNRVLTTSEVEAAMAFIERSEPIPNCDCNVCSGKVTFASWWLGSEPIGAFQPVSAFVFDGMTVEQAQDILLSRGD